MIGVSDGLRECSEQLGKLILIEGVENLLYAGVEFVCWGTAGCYCTVEH